MMTVTMMKMLELNDDDDSDDKYGDDKYGDDHHSSQQVSPFTGSCCTSPTTLRKTVLIIVSHQQSHYEW